MDKLLYYPYINLPQNDWTIRTLLYYDSISTIVPRRAYDRPELFYNENMRELLTNGLVIPVDPLEALDEPWETINPFYTFLQGPGFDQAAKRNNFILGNYIKIHSGKFDGEVFYYLEYLKLARKLDNDLYIVEHDTANYLMAFLANILSIKLNLQPITDKKNNNQDILLNSIIQQEKKREIILRELIPFPQNIDLDKLYKFKEIHYELLKLFRNKVEQIVLDNSLKEGDEIFNFKIKELISHKEMLQEKMNGSKLGPILFGTVCGITGILIGLCNEEQSLLSIPTLASSIYKAIKIEKAENTFDPYGMKYVAFIDKISK